MADRPARRADLREARPGTTEVDARWEAPTERSHYEAAWLRLANEAVPGAACEVLGYDERAGVIALRWLDPATSPTWKSQLLAGDVSVATATAVGNQLGRLHAAMAGPHDQDRAWSLARPLFRALRIEPYLLSTAGRCRDVAPRLYELAGGLAEADVGLIHGDVSPKNVLVGGDGPVLLDAECASPGDPAFDVAFCLNHLLLKSILLPTSAANLRAAAEAFAASYREQVSWEDPDALDGRAAALLPALSLARVFGDSPVEYLDEQGRATAASRSVGLLVRPADSLHSLFDRWYEVP